MVWEYDREKDCFWIRGTSGYDYEYATSNGLPPNSFVGTVFRTAKTMVLSREEAKQIAFQRPLKAEAIDVAWVGATPINLDKGKNRWGVLTLYGFRASERLSNLLLDTLATRIGKIISYWESVREAAAVAYARTRMSRVPDKGNARNEAARDILQEIFEADGVSLFFTEGPSSLVCVASTGLEGPSGPLSDLASARYDLNKDSGATVALCRQPRSVLRKIDATDEQEPVLAMGIPNQLPFGNKFRETAAWSPMERRRFMGVAVHAASEMVVVARIVRSNRSHPFKSGDGLVLLSVMDVLSEFIRPAGSPQPLDVRYRPDEKGGGRCQLDVAVGAMLQSSLISQTQKGVRGLLLMSVSQNGPNHWQASDIFEHRIHQKNLPERPRFYILPDELSPHLQSFKERGVTQLVGLSTGSDSIRLSIPFLVPFNGKAILHLLAVDYSDPRELNANAVACWAHLAQKVNVLMGLAGVSGKHLSKAEMVTKIRKQKLLSANNAGRQYDIWFSEQNDQTPAKSLGITCGPSLVGFGVPNTSADFCLQLLAWFLESGPVIRCKAVQNSVGDYVWELQEMASQFQKFLRERSIR